MLVTTLLGTLIFVGMNLGVPASPVEAQVGEKQNWILFVSNRDSPKQLVGIYRMKAGGSKVKRISKAKKSYDFDPVYSPDRKHIAFVAPNRVDDYTTSIWVMDADGDNRKMLTKKNEMACTPRWSPDGKQIAFCEMDFWSGDKGVYVMNRDGSDRRKLAGGTSPFWSPDGKQIAFFSSSGLAVMDANGGKPKRLSKHGIKGTGDWSPDGQKIVFVGAVKHPNKSDMPAFDLYVIDANGSNTRKLTETDGWEISPRWSCDGKRVYFARIPEVPNEEELQKQGNEVELFVIDADGQNEQQLTDNSALDCFQAGSWVWLLSHPQSPNDNE